MASSSSNRHLSADYGGVGGNSLRPSSVQLEQLQARHRSTNPNATRPLSEQIPANYKSPEAQGNYTGAK